MPKADSIPQAGSTYDNTESGAFFSEDNLIKAEAMQRHDVQFPHRKEFWMEEIENPYGPNIRYRMWKTYPCGQKNCHHPMYSPMPI